MESIKKLMLEWEFDESIIENFLHHQIEVDQLEELNDDYIKELVPKIGDRIKLKNKIKARKAAVVRDNDGIQVKEIILDSAKGVQVIEHYEENGNLTHEQRIIIVNIILDWTFERKLHLPRDLQKLITTQICEVFPTEKTTTYYKPCPGGQPTGLFHQYFNNRKQALVKKKNVVVAENLMALNKDAFMNCLSKDNTQESFIYLRDEIEGNDDYDLIIEHWKKTFQARKIDVKICKGVEEFFDHWPILRKSYSYKLVGLDFLEAYGEQCAESLLKNWNTFFDSNTDVLIRLIKDVRTKAALADIEDIESQTAKQITVLLALHNLFPPSAIKTKDKRWKPTVSDSKNSFFKVVEMLADMEREVRVRRKMCLLKGINNHPMIFGIGNMSTPGEISAFYVVVLDVSFHFKSLLEAIDTAFKMFNIFSIQYPPESSKVWSFLNEVFYQIESRGSPTIESIVSSFTKIIH